MIGIFPWNMQIFPESTSKFSGFCKWNWPFQTFISFLSSFETLENVWFSDIFREKKKMKIGQKWIKSKKIFIYVKN